MGSPAMRMEFDGARECKKGLDNGFMSVEGAIKSLDSVISKLETVWEGDSSKRFCEEYRTTLKKSLVTVKDAIKHTADDLQGDINRWQQMDQSRG